MATYFSLRDGLLTDASTYGYSLSSAEVMNQTTGTMILTSSLHSLRYASNGDTISAIAVHLSGRSNTPTGELNLSVNKISDTKNLYDNSSNKHNVTTVGNGNVRLTNFSPFNTNGWSCYFDGVSHLSVPYNANDFAFNTGIPFTIECWVNLITNAPLPAGTSTVRRMPIIDTATNSGWDGYGLYINANQDYTGTGILFRATSVANRQPTTYDEVITATVDIPKNRWHHIAVVRDQTNTIYIYLNGIRLNANATSLPNAANLRGNNFLIGKNTEDPPRTYYFSGNISNLRVVRQALYQGNFIPPTTNFGLNDNGGAVANPGPIITPTAANVRLLTFQDSRFKDNSDFNKNLTLNISPRISPANPFNTRTLNDSVIHGGSVLFFGATYTSYLSSNNSIFSFGTSDFTVELWVYINQNNGNNHTFLIDTRGADQDLSFCLYYDSGDSRIKTYLNNANQLSGSPLITNEWRHIAVTKRANVAHLWVNGVSAASASDTTNYVANNCVIGARFNKLLQLNGYISNLRVLKGTALYTSDFTPPVDKLNNINNTSFLLNTDNSTERKFTVTQNYPVSSFTGYDGSNNLTTYSQNWQTLKLKDSLVSSLSESINFSLSTSNPNQLSLIGSTTAVDATGLNDVGVTRAVTTGSISLSSGKPYPNFQDSFFFNGTDNWLVSPASPLYNLDRDFTIEFWVNTSTFLVDAGGSRQIFGCGPNTINSLFIIFFNGTAASPILSLYSSVGTTVLQGTSAVADGRWHHVAVVRFNNALKLFVDGGQSGPTINSNQQYNAGVNNTLTIGSFNNTQVGRFTGCINEFRIVNGTAVYTTSSFSPPTAPLEYIPNTVFLLKNGVNYDKALITGFYELTGINTLTKTGTTLSADSPFGSGVDGSLVFNGTTDHLAVPANRIVLGTSDFTIEMWVRTSVKDRASNDNVRRIFSSGAGELQIVIDPSSGSINVIGIGITGTINIANGIWNHICLMRRGSNAATFINGVQSGSIATNVTANFNNTPSITYIGTLSPSTGPYSGQISNLRVIKGEAIYPFATFTPPALPTAPLNTYFKGKTSTQFLYKTPYSANYLYNLSVDDIHISSLLDGYNTQTITVTADTITLDDLAVHNKGILTFPQSSTTLTVTKPAGLMVTSEGTLQIGTSSNPVPADTTHQILLSGNNLNVANGGRLDVYGAYKVPYTRLSNPSLSTARTFTVVDDVSSTWKVNDTLIFTPNTAQSTSYDELVLSSFDSNSTFKTTASARFAHSVLDYIPNVANLTRNVKIGGISNSAKGTISTKGEAIASLNNVEFKFINNSLNNSIDTGMFIASACTLSGNGSETFVVSPEPYSTVFAGTNTSNIKYLSDSRFNLGKNSTFTLECFFNTTSLTTTQRIFNYYDGVGNANTGYAWYLDILTDGRLSFVQRYTEVTIDKTNVLNSITKVKLDTWYHVAVVGVNGTAYIYVNGILENTIALVNGNFNAAWFLWLGGDKYTGSTIAFKGKLSNARYVHGSALYNKNFSVPHKRLTSISGTGISTLLLTCQDNPVRDNSSLNTALIISNVTYSIDSGISLVSKINILNNNILFKTKTGIQLRTPEVKNANISNNLLLSSTYAGMEISNLSGNSLIRNITIGPSLYGSLLTNNLNDATFNSSINYNNTFGTYINGDHIGTISNSTNTYNTSAGVFVDSSITNLNATTFNNITASNNSLIGFSVSGNNNNYVTPITLNINGLVANNNLSGGLEAYNITGNLNSLSLLNNFRNNIRTSLGNGYTSFSNLTSIFNLNANQYVNVNILTCLNYNQTLLRNINLSSISTNGSPTTGLSINIDKLEEFRVENTTINATTPLNLNPIRNKIEGSYLFYNSNSNTYDLNNLALTKYQTDIHTETGICVIDENGITNNTIKYLPAGNISYDPIVKYDSSSVASEKLEPMSRTIKLKSTSKLIPIKSNSSLTISVFVKKSSNYTGDAPRLMLVGNDSIGFSDAVLATSVATNNTWELLITTLPETKNAGMFEVYVDCSGPVGSGTINIDNWDLF